jgi:8-oxo-dGTP diphosphatase
MAKFCYDYPRPALTVDIVLFRYYMGQLQTLLIQRKNEPFAGGWAYPGGFVDEGETAEQAAVRELWEETDVHDVKLKQLYTETALNRDPRGWVVSVVYFAFVSEEIVVKAGDDAQNAKWYLVVDPPKMVFGHEVYLRKRMASVADQLVNSVFGRELLPDVFSLKELFKLYLQIINIPEQVEKIVKRLIDYNVLIQVGNEWHFEKGRYSAIIERGFLK